MRARGRRVVVLAVGVLAAAAASLAPPHAALAQSPVAITDVTVIPMDSEVVLERRTVVIENGRIAQISEAGAGSIPSGVTVFDGSGKFLIPGLADMHIHPGAETDLDLLLANGVTYARVMAGSPRTLAWRDAVQSGGRLGPRLLVAGPIIEGTPPPELAAVIPTAGKVLTDTRDEAATEVARQAEAGYDFIKVYNNLPLDAYLGVVEEAGRRGLPVAGHIPFELGLHGALDHQQTTIEHLRGYVWELVPADAPEGPGADLRSRTLAWRFADPALTRTLADETDAARVWNVPTLSTRIFKLPTPDLEAYLARPEAAYIPPGSRAILEDRSRIGWLSNFSEADFELALQSDSVQDALVRELQANGGRILAGTDITPWGFSLHGEIELLHQAGLTTYQALRTATANASEFVGQPGDWGVVREGARADLVLLDRNPLEDISATRSISAVVMGGRVLDRTALDTLLAGARPE